MSTIEINYEVLKPFYNEENYLSNQSIDKFLASKRIIRVDKYENITLLLDSNYKTPYFDLRDKILEFEKMRAKGKEGSMNIIIKEDINKKETNEITADDVNW